jgi:hypothetical protein
MIAPSPAPVQHPGAYTLLLPLLPPPTDLTSWHARHAHTSCYLPLTSRPLQVLLSGLPNQQASPSDPRAQASPFPWAAWTCQA